MHTKAFPAAAESDIGEPLVSLTDKRNTRDARCVICLYASIHIIVRTTCCSNIFKSVIASFHVDMINNFWGASSYIDERNPMGQTIAPIHLNLNISLSIRSSSHLAGLLTSSANAPTKNPCLKVIIEEFFQTLLCGLKLLATRIAFAFIRRRSYLLRSHFDAPIIVRVRGESALQALFSPCSFYSIQSQYSMKSMRLDVTEATPIKPRITSAASAAPPASAL